MVYINSIILLYVHSLADVVFLVHRKLKGKFICDWDNWKENLFLTEIYEDIFSAGFL